MACTSVDLSSYQCHICPFTQSYSNFFPYQQTKALCFSGANPQGLVPHTPLRSSSFLNIFLLLFLARLPAVCTFTLLTFHLMHWFSNLKFFCTFLCFNSHFNFPFNLLSFYLCRGQNRGSFCRCQHAGAGCHGLYV